MAVLAQLRHDPFVLRWIRRRDDPGRVARRRPEQRRTTDVDHLDGFVEADELDADRRCERLDVHDDEIDRDDLLRRQLGHLLGHVAPRQDARVDGVMERLDLPADGRLAGRQVRDGCDLDAVPGQVLPGAVGGEDLDVQCAQVASQRGDPVAIGD